MYGSEKVKVYIMDVLDYVGLLVSTNFMLLLFASIKIIIKYPPNDCKYFKNRYRPLMI